MQLRIFLIGLILALIPCSQAAADTIASATDSFTVETAEQSLPAGWVDPDLTCADMLSTHKYAIDAENSLKRYKQVSRTIVCFLVFAASVGIVWLILYYRRLNMLDRYHVIEKSLAEHQQLPESFYYNKSSRAPRNMLLTGFYWIGGGLAIFFFFMAEEPSGAAFGLLPIFIGIGRIVYYKVSTKNPSDSRSDNSSDAKQD